MESKLPGVRDELEHLLADLHDDGKLESEGHFTLDTAVALEKLGRFALAEPELWILKVVQAAVWCGSPFLEIKQSTTETVFRFRSPESWSLAGLESAFHLEQAGDKAMASLIHGLWAVSLNDGRPFRLELPGATHHLVWSGQKMLRHPAPSGVFRLTVAVRKRSEGLGFFGIRSIQASSRNASEAKVLVDRAFCAPLQLTLDGRRLDGLQFCPGYGFGNRNHPIAMGWNGEGQLRVPPGTTERLRSADGSSKQEKALTARLFPEGAGPTSVRFAWLVSAHFYLTDGKNATWVTSSSDSQLFWIQGGVVLQSEALTPGRCVSVALFLDAEAVSTDLSGLQLVQAAERQAQGAEILALAQQAVAEVPPLDMGVYIQESRTQTRAIAVVAGGAALVSLVAGPYALPVVLAAGTAFALAGQSFEAIQSELRADQSALARKFVR